MLFASLALAIFQNGAFAETTASAPDAGQWPSQTQTNYERARDFVNTMENVQPRLFEVGKYKPALMSDDMYGIWLQYPARHERFVGSIEHYFRLREFNQIVLSETISGMCQLRLTSPEFENGFYWDDVEGWERGAASLYFRSKNCTALSNAGNAFTALIEMDGGRANFVSRLR